MKKSKKKLVLTLVIVAAVLVVALAIIISMLWRTHIIKKNVEQQNYVAARLLELRDYEEGRRIAAENEQRRPNAVSRELLVLAAGFQQDYDSGIQYGQTYLEAGDDEVISQALSLYQDFTDAASTYEDGDSQDEDLAAYETWLEKETGNVTDDLLRLLISVQNSMNVKVDGDTVQALLNVIAASPGMASSWDLEILKEDGSAMADGALLSYAVSCGDYDMAYETAVDLYQADSSFVNRAALANVTAEWGDYIDDSDAAIQDLKEKRDEGYEELNGLSSQYYQNSSNYGSIASEAVQSATKALEEQIQSYEEQIQSLKAKKAINFVEITTPAADKDTVANKMELSQLYYKAGDEDQSRQLLMEAIDGSDGSDEAAALLVNDFVQAYLGENGGGETAYYASDLDTSWQRVADMLMFVNADGFYAFVKNALDEVYNGLVIREIDATQFPIVRVTVNVAMELEDALAQDDFALEDMGVPVEDFTLYGADEISEEVGSVSVELVVDRSGSMAGEPTEDTVAALSNFVNGVDADFRIGITIFNDSSSVLVPMGSSRVTLLDRISGIYGDGGTAIATGLKTAAGDLAGEAGRKVIILMSDGQDGSPGMIDEVIAELNRQNIYVYTIAFGDADADYLQYIADSCGGRFVEAASSDMLTEIYAAIGSYIANDYILEFEAVTDTENFDRYLRIDVDVNNAYAEKNYFVGVPYDDIQNEEDEPPLANYFQQIGGSATKEDGDE